MKSLDHFSGFSWCSTGTVLFASHHKSPWPPFKQTNKNGEFKWTTVKKTKKNRIHLNMNWDHAGCKKKKKGWKCWNCFSLWKSSCYQFAQKLCFLCSCETRKLVMQNDLKQACSIARWLIFALTIVTHARQKEREQHFSVLPTQEIAFTRNTWMCRILWK